MNKIIKRLRKKIDRQFNAQFGKLNERFGEYFKELFGGGKAEVAQMELEVGSRESEVGDLKSGVRSQEIGVMIVAEPPGKKIKDIMALSGGERSLTAVALICAIVASTPPPFVILDEIDAALDDANSNRLAEILKRLSGGTQFIIITHNRATMEIADILYGVTMDGSGVSKLVSVKLEEYE
jgi:chromosome segregation protein